MLDKKKHFTNAIVWKIFETSLLLKVNLVEIILFMIKKNYYISHSELGKDLLVHQTLI